MGAVKEYYHHRSTNRVDDRVFDEWRMELHSRKIREYFKKKGIK